MRACLRTSAAKNAAHSCQLERPSGTDACASDFLMSLTIEYRRFGTQPSMRYSSTGQPGASSPVYRAPCSPAVHASLFA